MHISKVELVEKQLFDQETVVQNSTESKNTTEVPETIENIVLPEKVRSDIEDVKSQ